jgi:hypothetical protein
VPPRVHNPIVLQEPSLMPRLRNPIVLAAITAVLAAVLVLAGPAAGHDLGLTRTAVLLLPDGTFRIDMIADLDALALGVPQTTDNAELARILESMDAGELEQTIERLRETFLRRVRVRFDGKTFLPAADFPDRGGERARRAGAVLGLTARLSGALPAGARELTVQASRAFPPLHLTFYDLRGRPGAAPSLQEILPVDAILESLATGTAGEPAAGSGQATGEEARGSAGAAQVPEAAAAVAPGPIEAGHMADLVTMRQMLERGARSDPYPLDRPPPPPSRGQVVRQYLWLGYEHILPLGLDHILFVLGLYLLNTAWRPLLVQVTAFTAAHTLTLGLSTYGVVGLSPAIVEPLIALSIAWVAFENVATSELKPWRPALVFGFGLLHGLGFAGVLSRLGLPRDQYLTALLSFNAGVELGQLTVILLAFAALGWFHRRPWYRARIAVPLSIAIGLIGLYWAVQRVFWP